MLFPCEQFVNWNSGIVDYMKRDFTNKTAGIMSLHNNKKGK